MSDKDNNSTEHFKIVKPDPETPVSEDVHTIRTAFDLIDALLKVISEAVAKKAEQDHIHDFAGVDGLEDELKEFRRKDEDINIGDLGDVLNPEDAQLNYVLAKTAVGFAFRSALSVLGEHQHPMANVVGLQDVLNTFLSGAAGSLDGEIPVFQGTSGKAVGRGGVTLASILQDIAGKAATTHEHSADNIVSGIFADARIPSLDASKVSTGVFLAARIPALNYAPLPYTGTAAYYTNYPVGTHVLAYGSEVANSTVTISYRSTTGSYEVGNSGTVLSGQWRVRGRLSGTPGTILAERVL